jgi:hypothetical protein
MRTRLACVAVVAVMAAACGGDVEGPVSAQLEGLALVSVQPASGPVSLSRSRPADCAFCTTSFAAELSVVSATTLPGVNLWLDGWSGSRRCLSSQHDSPADGFTLTGGQPTRVGFSQATVECAAPFTIDRIDARMRSGETIVYQGSWSVSLSFVE